MNFINQPNRIYSTDSNGKVVAEVTFPDISDTLINIDHTYVSESLRGNGVGNQLMFAAYNQIKSEDKKTIVTCSYAQTWFERHPGYRDILK